MTEGQIMELLITRVYTPLAGALILICGFFWNLRSNDKKEADKKHEQVAEQIKEEKEDITRLLDAKLSQAVGEIRQQSAILTDINEKVTDGRISSARMEQRLTDAEKIIDRREMKRD